MCWLKNQAVTIPAGYQFVDVSRKGEIPRKADRLTVPRTKNSDDRGDGHGQPRYDMYTRGYT